MEENKMTYYTSDELKKRCLDVIKQHELCFVEHIAAHVGVDKGTLYNHKMVGKEGDPEILEAIMTNRSTIKSKLLKKWFDSENATLQIALYKLLSEDEEFNKLVSNKIDMTTKGETINTDKDQLQKISDDIKKLMDND